MNRLNLNVVDAFLRDNQIVWNGSVLFDNGHEAPFPIKIDKEYEIHEGLNLELIVSRQSAKKNGFSYKIFHTNLGDYTTLSLNINKYSVIIGEKDCTNAWFKHLKELKSSIFELEQ